MLFSDVAGQQKAKDGLTGMWKQDTLPHALLLCGKEGTGGLPLSIAFAQYILCSNKSDNGACGKCPSCGKVARLEHADLHFSFPIITPKQPKKALSSLYIREFREFVTQSPYGTTFEWIQHITDDNKQGNISADECRNIIEKLSLRSYEGGKKVLILWRPEFLGREGNILLKVIEEPPNDTIIMLVAEEMEEILPTILSRVQLIRLAPVKAADIASALTSRYLANPRQAAQIAQLSMGSYTHALKLVRGMDNDLFPEVRNLFNVVFTNNGPGMAKFAEDWAKENRDQQKNFLTYVVQLIEQTVRAKYLPDTSIALPAEEAEFVSRLAASRVSIGGFGELSKAVSDTIYFIERNAHSKSQLLALTIRMRHIAHNIPPMKVS